MKPIKILLVILTISALAGGTWFYWQGHSIMPAEVEVEVEVEEDHREETEKEEKEEETPSSSNDESEKPSVYTEESSGNLWVRYPDESRLQVTFDAGTEEECAPPEPVSYAFEDLSHDAQFLLARRFCGDSVAENAELRVTHLPSMTTEVVPDAGEHFMYHFGSFTCTDRMCTTDHDYRIISVSAGEISTFRTYPNPPENLQQDLSGKAYFQAQDASNPAAEKSSLYSNPEKGIEVLFEKGFTEEADGDVRFGGFVMIEGTGIVLEKEHPYSLSFLEPQTADQALERLGPEKYYQEGPTIKKVNDLTIIHYVEQDYCSNSKVEVVGTKAHYVFSTQECFGDIYPDLLPMIESIKLLD